MKIKATPKSCSCPVCKAGKRSNRGKALMKADERAYRHASKINLMKGSEVIEPAPAGGYYD